ncbi:GNAT family N-acetyltransferase [Acidovorax lacteus]|uniref:GNAT family N-acetyltransferase n=1 Tax=Acidovorax lacteus TaxID=1924988 RepID=A0ABP8L4A5_9BURK
MSPSSTPNLLQVLEECALNAWPAPRTVLHQGWVLRANGGFTKRANAVSALQDQAPWAGMQATAEAHYARLGQPAVFRITALAPAEADAALEQAGYRYFDPSWVMTAPLEAAAPDARVHCAPEPTAPWLDGTAAAQGYAVEAWPLHHATVRAVVPPHVCATLWANGQALGYGLAVCERGWVGLFDLVVLPSARGQGLGTALVRALMDWGRQAGAQAAYLQVRSANPRAQQLYERLGFVPTYRYHYRVPGSRT